MLEVSVASKLPFGLVIEHPLNSNQKIELKGINQFKIQEIPYAITKVDAEFWDQWYAVNKNFAPVKNGSIFNAKKDGDLLAKAKEMEKLKTGFEGCNPDAPAAGINKVGSKKDE